MVVVRRVVTSRGITYVSDRPGPPSTSRWWQRTPLPPRSPDGRWTVDTTQEHVSPAESPVAPQLPQIVQRQSAAGQEWQPVVQGSHPQSGSIVQRV
jgi:hypothetical protein